jgi:hypothetical protein
MDVACCIVSSALDLQIPLASFSSELWMLLAALQALQLTCCFHLPVSQSYVNKDESQVLFNLPPVDIDDLADPADVRPIHGRDIFADEVLEPLLECVPQTRQVPHTCTNSKPPANLLMQSMSHTPAHICTFRSQLMVLPKATILPLMD